jgi:TolA-binding protein
MTPSLSRWTLLALLVAVLARSGEAAEPPPPKKTSTQEVKKQASEAVETTGRYLAERKEDFATRMQQRLDALNSELARAREAAAEGKKEVQKDVQQKIADLENKKAEADRKLTELRKAGGSAWESLRSGVEKAVGDLEDGFKGEKGKAEGAKGDGKHAH